MTITRFLVYPDRSQHNENTYKLQCLLYPTQRSCLRNNFTISQHNNRRKQAMPDYIRQLSIWAGQPPHNGSRSTFIHRQELLTIPSQAEE